MSTYKCVASIAGLTGEATVDIGSEAVSVAGMGEKAIVLSFADIADMRLLNYRVHVRLTKGEAVFSKLGYQTENFFEKLWLAFAGMSERSLFIEGARIMSCEGDYAYEETVARASSIAKLTLYSDCLSIVPHDAGARRVPLCFVDSLERNGFAMNMRLDTGERYRVARLGRETDPFFKRLSELRERAGAEWRKAHGMLERDLRSRLGDATEAYQVFCALPATVVQGLFSAHDEAFWFAAVSGDRAAVELVTDEQSATYLYSFDTEPAAFVAALRHAMEAVKTNRRLIFMPQDDLEAVPLYRMALERSAHTRFLRACSAGRIVHAASWKKRLEEFFA